MRTDAARRDIVLVVLGALILCAVLIAPAQAFTVQGGTSEQRAYVTRVINACWLAAQTTDSELRAFGPVQVRIVDMAGVSSYSKMGTTYINDDFLPGELLGELAAHEWAHQIWYSLGPKWWEKWAEICDPSGVANASTWRLNIGENFAECVKVALWGSEYTLRDYACTDLAVTDPTALISWLTLARYVNKCPFADLAPTAMPTTYQEDELAAAGGYVYTEGIIQGYADGTFRPAAPLTRQQLAAICERAGLYCPAAWHFDSSVATRGEVRATIPGLTWTADRWYEPIIRGQLARLIWRSR
jgi:hypothetical protein